MRSGRTAVAAGVAALGTAEAAAGAGPAAIWTRPALHQVAADAGERRAGRSATWHPISRRTLG